MIQKNRYTYRNYIILNSKIGAFKRVYEDNEGEVNFGKFFLYDPKKYYFNEHDKKIIDA